MNLINKIVSLTVICSSMLVLASDLTGKVQYEGKPPRPKKLNMAADPICGKAHDGAIFNESFLINKDEPFIDSNENGIWDEDEIFTDSNENGIWDEGQYMQNVVVWIQKPNHNHEIPSTPIQLDQKGCQYIPHVTGIMKGQDMIIKNSDRTLHNIHSMSKINSNFNFAMPAKSDNQKKSFSKNEDPFYIKCDVHPWMKSWVVILDHPYWGVTDQDGNYSINLDSLEAGTYNLCFWHEKWDKSMKKNDYCSEDFKQTVVIGEQSVNTTTKIFKKPAKAKKK
jgi:hypothetical protein